MPPSPSLSLCFAFKTPVLFIQGALSFILIKSEIEYQKLVYKWPLCIPRTQRNSPRSRPEAKAYLVLILPFCFGCHCLSTNCCLRIFPLHWFWTSVSPEPGREIYQSCLLYISKRGGLRKTDRQAGWQTDGHKHWQRERHAGDQGDIQMDRRVSRQTDRRKDGRADRQTDRQTGMDRNTYL